MVGLDLFLAMECTCTGDTHHLQCDIQSKLPITCPIAPNLWLIQYGKFVVRDEMFNPHHEPVVPYKTYREFGVTVKTPVKKNSKEEGSYFVDVEVPRSGKNFLEWVAHELEKTYGQMKHQNRLHILLTNQQWKRVQESSRNFRQFKGTARSVILVRERKGVNTKVEGPLESDILWRKKLRPTADTMIDVPVGRRPAPIHAYKKQCFIGCFLIFIFCLLFPLVVYLYVTYLM